MIHWTPILAEGIPPGVLFAIAVAVVFAIANAVAKKKQSEAQQAGLKAQRMARQPSPREQTLAEVVREQLRRSQAKPPALPTAAKRAAQKKRAAPPPPPTVHVAPPAAVVAPTGSPIGSRERERVSQTAKNIRLLLQPAGIREAFLIGEVLGKPKSMREE